MRSTPLLPLLAAMLLGLAACEVDVRTGEEAEERIEELEGDS
jgi:hypothetical protein